MWAYLTIGMEPEDVARLAAAYDGETAEPERGGRNVAGLLAGMSGG